jgi:FAD/FMN-containing dehydrogenase
LDIYLHRDYYSIAYVNIDETRRSARIGGGVLNGTIAAELSKEGLATAVGAIPFIGYAGWSSYGGCGPFSANYGLGLDNIIGARVVNWKGEIVEANQEMLKGVRGAGGFIGVLVELTIKVSPLKKVSDSWSRKK